MMRRAKQAPGCHATGQKGRNRVRVFPDPKTGMYQLEWK